MATQNHSASSNLTNETRTGLPLSVDVAEAVALMGDLDAAAEDEADETASAHEDEGDEAAEGGGEEGGGEADEPAEEEADEEAEASADDGEAPEFWSAEDKAAWNDVPAGVRPVLKKYEQQRTEFADEKVRQADTLRAQATQDAERASAVIAQAARWWQQSGPALQQAFADKWATVDWKTLAEKDPAEYARLDQQRQKDQALLADANRRQQEDTRAATERAVQALGQAKHVENAKLAAKLPDYFGTRDKAARTYADLGKFLLAKGIPAERIVQIYEAPIVELALAAMRFDRAQQKALAAKTSARRTPARVAPGPAGQTRAGNRDSDSVRQAGERFRKSGGNSIADAAELIRLSGL